MKGHASWDAISLRRIKAACDSKDGCKRGGMATLLLRLELSFAKIYEGMNLLFFNIRYILDIIGT